VQSGSGESLLAVAVTPARAAEYVLSPDGDDSAAGDRENPWRTIVGQGDDQIDCTFPPPEYRCPEFAGTAAPTDSAIHYVFIGEVADIAIGDGAPLVYAKRAYRGLGLPLEAMAAAA